MILIDHHHKFNLKLQNPIDFQWEFLKFFQPKNLTLKYMMYLNNFIIMDKNYSNSTGLKFSFKHTIDFFFTKLKLRDQNLFFFCLKPSVSPPSGNRLIRSRVRIPHFLGWRLPKGSNSWPGGYAKPLIFKLWELKPKSM